jgi:hypothetical protein
LKSADGGEDGARHRTSNGCIRFAILGLQVVERMLTAQLENGHPTLRLAKYAHDPGFSRYVQQFQQYDPNGYRVENGAVAV